MKPALGTAEWFTWHAEQRVKTRHERRERKFEYRPALWGPSGEQYWWRTQLGPVQNTPKQVSYLDADMPDESTEELASLKAALVNPIKVVDADTTSRQKFSFRSVFDRNKIAG